MASGFGKIGVEPSSKSGLVQVAHTPSGGSESSYSFGVTTSGLLAIGPGSNPNDADNQVILVHGNSTASNKSQVTISANVTIEGNLTVLGNTTVLKVQSETVSIGDNMIQLNANTSVVNGFTPEIDFGFYGQATIGGTVNYAGVAFDNSANAITTFRTTTNPGREIANIKAVDFIDTGALSVANQTTLNNTLTTEGATTLKNTLSVGGNTRLTSVLSVGGASVLSGTLSVSGHANITSSVFVGGNVTATYYFGDGSNLTNISGVNTLDDIGDTKMGGANFTGSLLNQLDGDAPTTGTLNNANDNIGIGRNVMDALTEGDGNIGFGFDVLTDLTTGSNNVAFGYEAGKDITTGSNNVLLGKQAEIILQLLIIV